MWIYNNVHLQHMSIHYMSVFHHKTGFSQTSQLLFMFQCNEMNKFLCSLACTWMTIIDSQFYIILDSLSLDVSLAMQEWNCLFVFVSNDKCVRLYIMYIRDDKFSSRLFNENLGIIYAAQKDQKLVSRPELSLNAGQKYCRMLRAFGGFYNTFDLH